MWRRAISSPLKALAPRRSTAAAALATRPLISSPVSAPSFSSLFGAESVKKRVEDVMPIATGHEREELEAELEGKDILEINYPVGPFGTKEAPAVVQSYYGRRIVGCPGGEGAGCGRPGRRPEAGHDHHDTSAAQC